jgi:hypothetical protein
MNHDIAPVRQLTLMKGDGKENKDKEKNKKIIERHVVNEDVIRVCFVFKF